MSTCDYLIMSQVLVCLMVGKCGGWAQLDWTGGVLCGLNVIVAEREGWPISVRWVWRCFCPVSFAQETKHSSLLYFFL